MSSAFRPVAIRPIAIRPIEQEIVNELSEEKIVTSLRKKRHIRTPLLNEEHKKKYIKNAAIRRGIISTTKCTIGYILDQECTSTEKTRCSIHFNTTVHTISKERVIHLTDVKAITDQKRVNWIQFEEVIDIYFESENKADGYPKMFFLRFTENNKVYSFSAYWYMHDTECYISFQDEEDRNFALSKLQKIGYTTAKKSVEDIKVNWSGNAKRLKYYVPIAPLTF